MVCTHVVGGGQTQQLAPQSHPQQRHLPGHRRHHPGCPPPVIHGGHVRAPQYNKYLMRGQKPLATKGWEPYAALHAATHVPLALVVTQRRQAFWQLAWSLVRSTVSSTPLIV